jgi:hypothetical protein
MRVSDVACRSAGREPPGQGRMSSRPGPSTRDGVLRPPPSGTMDVVKE